MKSNKKKVKAVSKPEEISESIRTIITFVLLLFPFPPLPLFFPFLPIGLLVMWFWTRWPLWVKIVITIISIFPLTIYSAVVAGLLAGTQDIMQAPQY